MTPRSDIIIEILEGGPALMGSKAGPWLVAYNERGGSPLFFTFLPMRRKWLFRPTHSDARGADDRALFDATASRIMLRGSAPEKPGAAPSVAG